MKHKIVLLTITILCLSTFFYSISFTNSGGPAAGKTGAPGDGLCTDCHSGTANTGLGTVSLSVTDAGNPITAYTPGTKYTVTATVTESGRSKFGFQMVPFLNSSNTMAGSWTLTELTRTQTKTSGSKIYVEHTSTGNAQTSAGTNTWTADWTAPTTGSGTVKFYAAFNATNSSGSTSGDNIYTTSFTLTEEIPVTPPVAGFSVSATTICLNGSVSFTNLSTDATSYLWDFGDGTNSTAVNPSHTYSISGTFTVSLTATGDGGTDVETKNNFITVLQPILASVGSDITICNGTSASLLASATGGNGGSYSFSWSPSTGLSSDNVSNPTASPSSTTTYTVFVSDGCSPFASNSVTVTALPSVSVVASSNVSICAGASTQLNVTTSGGMGLYTYSWSPVASLSDGSTSNPSATPDATTIYTVFVDDGCSSIATDEVTVSVSPPITVFATANPSTICQGQSVTLSASASGGSGAPFTYSWTAMETVDNPNMPITSASPSTTSNYIVYVGDGGCSQEVSANVIVMVMPPITINTSADFSLCIGEIGNLSAMASGGNGEPYSYSWVPTTGLSSADIPNPSIAISTTTTYTLYVSDGCSPDASASQTITVNDYLAAPVLNCGNTTTSTIEFVWESVTEAISYEISIDSGLTWVDVGSALNTSFSGFVPDETLQMQIRAINPSLCSPGKISSQICIAQNCNALSASVTNDTTVCFNSLVVLSVTGVTGGSGNYFYSWSSGFPDTPGPHSLNITSPALITVSIGDSLQAGCPLLLKNINMRMYPLLAVNAGSDKSICFGGSVPLIASVTNSSGFPLSYSWVPSTGLDNNTISNPMAIPTVSTTYSVYVTDGCSQEISDVVVINVGPSIFADAGPDVSMCEGDVTTLFAMATGGNGGPYSYSWVPSTGLSSSTVANPVASSATSTTYTVFVSDGCSQEEMNTVTVSINPYPSTPVISCGTITLSSIEWTWSPVAGVMGYEASFDGGFTWKDFGDSLSFDSTGLNQGTALSLSLRGYKVFGPCIYSSISTQTCISSICPANQAEFSFSMIGDTVQFIPDNTFGNSFVWDFGDGKTDTSSVNVSHVYDTSGIYYVCVKSFTIEDCYEEFCDSVEYVKVGVSEKNTSYEITFTVSPNPGKDEFQVMSSCCRMDIADEVWLINLQGQILGKYHPDINGKFHPGKLNHGMYFLKIRHTTSDKTFWNLSPFVVSE